MTTLSPRATLHPLARAAFCASFAGALLFGTTAVSAQQAKPPTQPPPPAPSTQPATPLLVPPKAPPPPTGTESRVIERTAVPSAVLQVKREGLPVESVRPDSAASAAPDPKFAPEKSPAPPSPRATSQVQRSTARELSVSASTPVGATARCKDGTFLTSRVDNNSCSDHGGLAVSFAQRQAPPPSPRRP